jgi:hypothetical protein
MAWKKKCLGEAKLFFFFFLVDVEERQRERETFCVTHTTTAGGKILQQQQLKNGRGAFFLLLLQRENKRTLSLYLFGCLYIFIRVAMDCWHGRSSTYGRLIFSQETSRYYLDMR